MLPLVLVVALATPAPSQPSAAPEPEDAVHYWRAFESNEILGRCVAIGVDDRVSPHRHYHWAICRGAEGALTVQEFWKPEVVTTAQYRSALRADGRCPEL